MIPFFGKFFEKKSDLQLALKNGAVIIDVRSPFEFDAGHIKGSKNIPLENLKVRVNEIKQYNKPVVIVCQNGIRSSTAQTFLKGEGVPVYNGGAWTNLNKII